MGLLWSFFRRFLRYPRPLICGFLAIPLAQGADVGVSVVIGNAINALADAEDDEFLRRVLILMAIGAVVHAVFRFFQRWLLVVVSRQVEVDLKQELFDKLAGMSFAFHDRSRSGDVVSRLTSDVENLRMFLGPGLMYTLGATVVVPLSLGVLFQIDAGLAATMVLPMVLMGVAMKVFSPRLHHFSVAVQESLGRISHRAQENFSGIRVVKGYRREDTQADLFAGTSAENRENQIGLARARGLTHAAVHGANELTFVVILVLGGLAAIDRDLLTGDLFKFVDLTFKVFWPLIALGWIAGMYPRAVASAGRVQELLDEVPEILETEDPVELDEVRGELRVEDVSFTYETADRPSLSGIDLVVPAGSTLGVVGPTGSGKTTLLHLFGRLFEAEGTISLDGVPLRDLSLASLRGAIGYVPQDSFLFSEEYEENIRFGADGDLSEGEVRDLIERAAMTDEVARFPNGLRQMIGERGVTLSGGQRQRTCIARALARDPRVLILDDCLSAVDTETEKHLVASLRSAGEGRTVVIAAHRLSTVRDADRILVLTEDGRVEVIGTHAELIEREGWYRRTWEQQERQEELSEL